MKITVHTVVRNEDQWIWFALQSVLPYVEQILIFDTGSTDNTVQIIKSINSPKIKLFEKGSVSPEQLSKLRVEQIKLTKTDWFLLVDGDEIWPESELKKLISYAVSSEKNIKAIYNRTRNSIGDIFHYLPDSAGRYQIGEHRGNLNLRLIRKTPDLTVTGVYPLEQYTDDHGPLTEQKDNLKFADCWYLHTSFLIRSSLNNNGSGSLGKKKTPELGLSLSKRKLPEVLSLPRPNLVPDPYISRDLRYTLTALVNTPLLFIKRCLD